MNQRLNRHLEAVVDVAHGICGHFKADAFDDEGRPLNPCVKCVKTVRHVLEAWTLILAAHGAGAKKRQKQKDLSIFVTLHDAYRIGQSALDPDASLAMENYGPL